MMATESKLNPEVSHISYYDADELAAREVILDHEFLNRPEVIAQRIQREYIKSCQKAAPFLLKHL